MDVGTSPLRAVIDNAVRWSLTLEAACKLRRPTWIFRLKSRQAKYGIGQIVKHRIYPFRGVIFDIDPEFANTEDWWQSIPAEARPRKDQPFYHLLAENSETEYIAYVSEQNLLPDTSGEPLRHPQIDEFFDREAGGGFRTKAKLAH
jgi:heat shock protein HspQ